MQIETVRLSELTLDAHNVRRHPNRNIAAIEHSLKRWGQQRPVVVDSKNVVRAGNGTVQAARNLGWATLQVVRTDLTGAELQAFAVADNRTAELAEWAPEVTAVVEDLKVQLDDLDFDALGLTDIDALAGAFTADAVELPELAAGDRDCLQQMTFTLTDEQAATLKDALAAAKAAGPFVDTGNENSNGNALARVAEVYLGQG